MSDASEEKIENLQPDSSAAFDGDGALLHPDVRKSAEKKLVRKLDGRLLPTIIVIFIMNYIDVSRSPKHSPIV